MLTGSILISHPDGREQEIPFCGRNLRIGSAPDNDLIIVGQGIAPHHATITCDERGRLIVEIGGENITGQGGMRLTFNLPQVAKKRTLAWIGDYVVSYQPATWEQLTQPLSLDDLPQNRGVCAPEAIPTPNRVADETDLLRALLNENVPSSGVQHEAVTLGMPVMILSTMID